MSRVAHLQKQFFTMPIVGQSDEDEVIEDIVEDGDKDADSDSTICDPNNGCIIEPPPCDPNYEYCGDTYVYDPYDYDKGDLHQMVWTALWQWSVPMMLFNLTEKKAYLDYYGEDNDDDVTTTDHYSRLV